MRDKKIIHIHNDDLCEIYNFGTLFLGHHYYMLSLSDQSLGASREEHFLRNTAKR